MKKTICALVLSLVPLTANALVGGFVTGTFSEVYYPINSFRKLDEINYRIKKGDTLYKLSKNLCKSKSPDKFVSYLTYKNSINNPNRIKEGVYIYLPSHCK